MDKLDVYEIHGETISHIGEYKRIKKPFIHAINEYVKDPSYWHDVNILFDEEDLFCDRIQNGIGRGGHIQKLCFYIIQEG